MGQMEQETKERTEKTGTFRTALTVLLPAAVLLGFSVAGLLLPDREISTSERRRLAQMPVFQWEAVASGTWMEEMEAYSQDQFPLREIFREIRALVGCGLLGQRDSHGIYLAGGYAAQLDISLDTGSVDYAAERFQNVYQRYLAGTASSIYVSVIPDKNQFLAEEHGYPCLDFEALTSRLQSQMPYASYVDLRPFLELADYYRTDIHWRQERLPEVAEALTRAMGATGRRYGRSPFTACTGANLPFPWSRIS